MDGFMKYDGRPAERCERCGDDGSNWALSSHPYYCLECLNRLVKINSEPYKPYKSEWQTDWIGKEDKDGM